MRGPFGGIVESADGSCREHAAPEVLACLPSSRPAIASGLEDGGEPVAGSVGDTRVRRIGYRVVDGALEWDLDPARITPVEFERDVVGLLAEAIARLHDEGRVHGDVRPALLGNAGWQPGPPPGR
jgi:hypothetical protein